MSKVPCGGFKLDENFLGMNENDELSLVGGSGEGKAYQQLVTDGEGNVKWEDRLAYDDSKVVATNGHTQFVKVSDKVPSWASLAAPMKYWLSNGTNGTIPTAHYTDLGGGSFIAEEYIVFVTTDNFKFNGYVFPEKGVYFLQISPDVYVSGIASADSDTPEIVWDGNVETIKTIDPKYIPSELNEIIVPSSTSGSTKKFKITVDDAGTISATEVPS